MVDCESVAAFLNIESLFVSRKAVLIEDQIVISQNAFDLLWI